MPLLYEDFHSKINFNKRLARAHVNKRKKGRSTMSTRDKRSWVTLAVVCLAVCTSVTVSARSVASPEPDYHYSGQVQIDDQSGRIRADWQITIYDESESEITFYLRDTLGDIEVTGPGITEVITEKQSGFGDFWAISVKLADLSAESPGRQRTVQISYEGVLLPEPMENLINTIEPGRVELNVDSFWFPIDSRFSKILTAELAVHVGEGWQGVTTGNAIAIEDGFRLVNTDPRLDIAFTLSKSFYITRAEGFTVFDQRAAHDGTAQLIDTASRCRSFLNTRFGAEDPLPAGKLLITARKSSGYSRENYIVFTDISDTEPGPLMRFVCHEFAHYWSQGAKFDTVDNWLNEAFAEYIGLMAVREYLGQGAYDEMLASFGVQIAGLGLPRIWKVGDSERGQELVQYRKGPLVLARLERTIGRAAFLEFIQTYFKSPDKTTPGLLRVLAGVAGPQHAKSFEVMLGE